MDDSALAEPDARHRSLPDAAAQQLVVETIAANNEVLFRTARRASLCHEDAEDAYQRSMEVFLRNASRLTADTALPWLHTVIRHEGMRVRRARSRFLGDGGQIDLDTQVAPEVSTPEERAISTDRAARAAEALKRLKPGELRALWLKAVGLSYEEIAAATGWSATKVNRLLSEGRRSFLERYAGIESGAECARWAGIVSAIVDGEATADQVLEARPHLRNCRPAGPRCASCTRRKARCAACCRSVSPH